MRYHLALLLMVLPLLPATAQDDEKKPGDGKVMPRFGFEYVPKLYPQEKPQDAIASVIKAIDAHRIDYLLAQLADAKFVDAQVAQYRALYPGGKDEARTFLAFDKLVKETGEYFLSDPVLVRELRVFAREAAWDINEDIALGSVKDLPARKVFLRNIGGRWFLENKQQ
jgi:hypothetical protein